jgi:hypothetical protein
VPSAISAKPLRIDEDWQVQATIAGGAIGYLSEAAAAAAAMSPTR